MTIFWLSHEHHQSRRKWMKCTVSYLLTMRKNQSSSSSPPIVSLRKHWKIVQCVGVDVVGKKRQRKFSHVWPHDRCYLFQCTIVDKNEKKFKLRGQEWNILVVLFADNINHYSTRWEDEREKNREKSNTNVYQGLFSFYSFVDVDSEITTNLFFSRRRRRSPSLFKNELNGFKLWTSFYSNQSISSINWNVISFSLFFCHRLVLHNYQSTSYEQWSRQANQYWWWFRLCESWSKKNKCLESLFTFDRCRFVILTILVQIQHLWVCWNVKNKSLFHFENYFVW